MGMKNYFKRYHLIIQRRRHIRCGLQATRALSKFRNGEIAGETCARSADPVPRFSPGCISRPSSPPVVNGFYGFGRDKRAINGRVDALEKLHISINARAGRTLCAGSRDRVYNAKLIELIQRGVCAGAAFWQFIMGLRCKYVNQGSNLPRRRSLPLASCRRDFSLSLSLFSLFSWRLARHGCSNHFLYQ